MKTIVRFTVISIILFVVILVPISSVFAQIPGGNPTYYPTWPPGGAAPPPGIHNPLIECSNLGTYAYAHKVDPPAAGTFNSSGNSITVSSLTAKTFNWSSTAGIGAVIVKAGTAANVWSYSPASTGGTGLYAPENKDIGHITFCWNAPPNTATPTNTATSTVTNTPTKTTTPTVTNTPTDTPTVTPTGQLTGTSTLTPGDPKLPTATRIPDDPKEPTPPPSAAPATGAPGGPAPLIIGMVISTLLAIFGFVLWRKPVV